MNLLSSLSSAQPINSAVRLQHGLKVWINFVGENPEENKFCEVARMELKLKTGNGELLNELLNNWLKNSAEIAMDRIKRVFIMFSAQVKNLHGGYLGANESCSYY